MGRFINADAYASTGQGLLGNNMFVYCGNNPVSYSDPIGKAFLPAMCKFNEGDNPHYILDQDDAPFSEIKIGNTTIGENGCGIVAIYNALLSMGKHKPFLDICAYFSENPLMISFGGKYGLSAMAVASYFSNNGYKVLVSFDPNEIDACSSSADAAILLYNFVSGNLGNGDFRIGGHFIEYALCEEGYIGRNTASTSGITHFTSPSGYGYTGNRFFAMGILVYIFPN